MEPIVQVVRFEHESQSIAEATVSITRLGAFGHAPSMSTGCWSPATYERFASERSQPFFDLLDLVARRPSPRVVDLGCGTGVLTRALHERLAASETLGLDRSSAMLEKTHDLGVPGLRFEVGDIEAFEPKEPFDLVFSNAALHWVPDHPRLFARLSRAVAPAGQLAIQVPANHEHASHRAAASVASQPEMSQALQGFTAPIHVLRPEAYAALLHSLGFERVSVRLQVYSHLLDSRDEVTEWVRGTLLTAYQERLPALVFEEFVRRYREELRRELPDERPFLLTYNRILMRASRPASVPAVPVVPVVQ